MVEQARERAGLPERRCPQCGQAGRHWVPDSLKGPGYFICTAQPAAATGTPLFERAGEGGGVS